MAWKVVQTELLGTLRYLCIPIVLHTSEPKENKYKDNQTVSCYSSWLIAQKTFLIKKNCLTCDHTKGEVLMTINNNFNDKLHIFKYTKPNL